MKKNLFAEIAFQFATLDRFFPIHLLLLHIRRSYLGMLMWILIFGLSGGYFFRNLGIQYLFCTPEYFERVGFQSYFLVGIFLGLFIMAFHLSSYIFYSHRFRFLAALNRPLYKFSLNNSIIPLIFYVFYIYHIFSISSEDQISFAQTCLHVLGLLLGSILTISLVFTYFFKTIKAIEVLDPELKKQLEAPLKILIRKDKQAGPERSVHVETYLGNRLQLRHVRLVQHYPTEMIVQTLQQHHLKASFFFLLIAVILFFFSLSSRYELFLIPASGSILLLFSLFLMIAGAIYSRVKTWTLSIVVLYLWASHTYSFFPFQSKVYAAFGLDYEAERVRYDYDVFQPLVTDSILNRDRQEMLSILNNWRAKFPKDTKPTMVIVNSSGGGLRSAMWTYGLLQKLSEQSNGEIWPYCFAIFGSSGGMLGAAYYREIEKRIDLDEISIQQSREFIRYLGKDLLNPVAFHLGIHDLFFRLRRFPIGNTSYIYDRGRAFEEQFQKNTGEILPLRLYDYKEDEKRGKIPLMVLSPVVVQDGRRMIISPHGLSFLTINRSRFTQNFTHDLDGVEFNRLFAQQQADSLLLLTALRMSASFPYITPLITLPTQPQVELIDAGVRDNEGFSLAMKFLSEFRVWLKENTSGVVMLRLKADREDDILLDTAEYSGGIYNLFKPIGGVFSSAANIQYFQKSKLQREAENWRIPDFSIHTFSLFIEEEPISLSWHLTQKEQQYILSRLQHADIRQAKLQVLKQCGIQPSIE